MTNSGLASYLKIYSSDGTPFLNHSIAFDSSSVALLGVKGNVTGVSRPREYCGIIVSTSGQK